MRQKREKSGRVGEFIGILLAALALVAIFSYPATGAIKRFKDDTGTLHITDEGAEKKAQNSASTPGVAPSRGKGPGAFPRPGAGSLHPPPPEPPSAGITPPDPALGVHGPGEGEEPPDKPTPGRRGR
jgi:hypothetical protein